MSLHRKKPLHKATHDDMNRLAISLVSVEQELNRLGLHATARAVNRAVRVIGWEFSGDFEMVKEAARSDVA